MRALHIIEAETAKNVFHALPRYHERDMVLVHSSHGVLKATPDGRVVEVRFNTQQGNLENIARFDFDEWASYWHGSVPGASIDILDVGYWMKDGRYEPPSDEFRDFRQE